MSDRLLLVISERLYTLFTRLGVSLNFSNLIGKKAIEIYGLEMSR